MADPETLPDPTELVERLAFLLGVEPDVIWALHLYDLRGKLLLNGPDGAVDVKTMGHVRQIMAAGFEFHDPPHDPVGPPVEVRSVGDVPADRLAVTCVPCGQVLSVATGCKAEDIWATGHGTYCRRNRRG